MNMNKKKYILSNEEIKYVEKTELYNNTKK